MRGSCSQGGPILRLRHAPGKGGKLLGIALAMDADWILSPYFSGLNESSYKVMRLRAFL
jgi:hypothetical protein